MLKLFAHAFLFLLAFVAFYLGLGLGLRYNATLGTVLWIVAAAILLSNLVWIVRSRR